MTKAAFAQFLKTVPQRAAQLRNIENVQGDSVKNAKNAHLDFDAQELLDMSYCQYTSKLKDCRDVN